MRLSNREDEDMSEVTVYGAPYSTYVRAVRLALEEKGVPYDLVEVGIRR